MQNFNIFNALNSYIFFLKEKYFYAFYGLYLFLMIVGIIFLYHLQFKFIHYKTKSKKIKLFQILIDSSFWPIVLFLMIQIISDRDNFFLKYLDEYIIFIINKFKKISFVWMCWLGFARLIKNIEKALIEDGIFKKTNDATIIKTITKTLTFIVYIIMVFMLMKIFGFKISSILAFIGGPAAIIIFAGKTVISDLLGGILMLMNKSFSIGEEIVIPEKNIEGRIIKIGLKKMSILTVDRNILSVPNSILSNVAIINKKKTQVQKIYLEIPVEKQYYDYINLIVEELKKMLYNYSEINKSCEIIVFCNKVDINMNFIIEELFYIKPTTVEKRKKIQQNCLLESIKILNEIIKNQKRS